MASDRDRRSLRSLRSDRMTARRGELRSIRLFRYLGILEKTTLTRDHRPPSTPLRAGSRSLRSDRDDSKERGVAFYTFVSLPGHLG